MKVKEKILVSILFVVCIIFIKNINNVDAATIPNYIWPIGGNNANETYMDYEFYGTAGQSPYKDGKSGREYIVNNELWPDEQPFYAKCESHYGMDITGMYGHSYKVVSVVEGTVIETSATYCEEIRGGIGIAGRTDYPEQNQRMTSDGLKNGGGYGNYIIIQETSTGRCFLYGHLKGGSFKVSRNDHVSVGQEIATMGSSGDSGHMHLHFEIRASKEKTIINMGSGLHRIYYYLDSTTNLDPKDYVGSTPKNIKEITFKEPLKKQYIQSEEELDLTGGAITVKYNSGITSTIELSDSNIKISGFNNKNIGKNEIAVEFEGKIFNFEVEIIEAKAKIEKITYAKYDTYRKIYIYFSKPITVETAPELKVKVGEKIKNATCLGTDSESTKLMYKIDYSQFDIFASGKMYISCEGNVKQKSTGNLVNFELNNIVIGKLNAYKIYNTYEIVIRSKKGDANADGIIDARDASLILTLYAKNGANQELTDKERDQMSRSDVNGDGVVDAIDASLVLSYYAGTSADYDLNEADNIIKCDLNGDYKVDETDYIVLKNGLNEQAYNPKYDINNDGYINSEDTMFFKLVVKKCGRRPL